LDTDKTVTVKVVDAQDYKDIVGYINLRVRWLNGQSPDIVPIYELWRADPVYAGIRTAGVNNVELAFDGDSSTFSSMAAPQNLTSSESFLYFKAYVGSGTSNTFTFSISTSLELDKIGSGHQLWIYVEKSESGSWDFVKALPLDTPKVSSIIVGDDELSPLEEYLDADGYINLRAEWIGPTQGEPLIIYEIWRTDPFFVVPNDDLLGWIADPENAVDGDFNSYTTMYFYWNEYVNDDFPQLQNFLHVQTFVGDSSLIDFSVLAAISAPPNALLIVDGEIEPGKWSAAWEPIRLGNLEQTTIKLSNAREFVTADGYLSLRLRWESDTIDHDAYIYEIWREEN